MEGSSKRSRKGKWTAEEDCLLRQCIDNIGEGKWHQVPLRAGLNRCRKSCRLRWLNYLKPSIKRGKLSYDEVDLLLRLQKLLGKSILFSIMFILRLLTTHMYIGVTMFRWSLIAGRLPGRTANDIKNYWNTYLSKMNESCCKIKIDKRNITSPPTKTTPKVDALKPQPRSFSINNGHSLVNDMLEVNVTPPCPEININNVCENNATSSVDELVNNLMIEDNMWLENFLEESQEANTLGPKAMTTEKRATLVFDVEQLWTMFHGETLEFD